MWVSHSSQSEFPTLWSARVMLWEQVLFTADSMRRQGVLGVSPTCYNLGRRYSQPASATMCIEYG